VESFETLVKAKLKTDIKELEQEIVQRLNSLSSATTDDEFSKRDRSAVQEFISENETQLATRVLREVKNKLKTELKNPKVDRD
jgi:hypothetical protein